jgi:flagellar M-ring protein FliF
MPNIIETFKNWPIRNKAIALVIISIALASIILTLTWMQKVDFQLLYSNLSEEDAGVIIQRLKEMKIPYKTTQTGIMVPSDRVHELRLQFATQGIPQGGGIGFEVFDRTNFSMTDFVQKLNYRRALQGELARTIRSLSEVEQCRVHISVPERSLFTREDERPKASVLLKLRQGRRLSEGQVQGIVHLVASSVEGLDPKDVTVVDSKGEMLTSPNSEIAGLSSSQIEFQRNYERELEGKIATLLEPVVGKGKARVKVVASLDFTRIEKTEERYDPDSQVIRSEQRSIEKSTGSSSGGVPGVGSNLPNRTTPTSGSSKGSERKNETINYEISKITSHIINNPGEIKRLSAVVLVDGTYTTPQGSKEKKYSPRSEEDLKKIEEMVKRAIGFNQERGDDVKVVNMPFEAVSEEELPAPKKEIMPVVLTAAKYAVPVIGIILIFLLIVKPLLKTLTAQVKIQQPQPAEVPGTVAGIERSKELPGMSEKDRILEWAKKNPQEAAGLIKSWIEEK